MNVAEALQALAALTALANSLADTIGKAQREGRDLTDAEVAAVVAQRRATVARFLAR